MHVIAMKTGHAGRRWELLVLDRVVENSRNEFSRGVDRDARDSLARSTWFWLNRRSVRS
jgi:hypothetical protein